MRHDFEIFQFKVKALVKIEFDMCVFDFFKKSYIVKGCQRFMSASYKVWIIATGNGVP